MEGNITKLKEERDQFYRQNKALTDQIDELKARTERSEQLEEDNRKLSLALTIVQRDQESFERRFKSCFYENGRNNILKTKMTNFYATPN